MRVPSADALGYQLETAAMADDAQVYIGDGFEAFSTAVAASVAAGQCPLDRADNEQFPKLFKDWVGMIGAATDRKGKRLFMPLRLALTGNLAGPDIGDQLVTVALAEKAGAKGVVRNRCPADPARVWAWCASSIPRLGGVWS